MTPVILTGKFDLFDPFICAFIGGLPTGAPA